MVSQPRLLELRKKKSPPALKGQRTSGAGAVSMGLSNSLRERLADLLGTFSTCAILQVRRQPADYHDLSLVVPEEVQTEAVLSVARVATLQMPIQHAALATILNRVDFSCVLDTITGCAIFKLQL